MQTHQLKSLVQRTRRGEYADWEGVISSFPLANCDDLDERLFLQFNTSVNIDQKLQKLVGFGHPDLIHNLKYGPVHLFVDCTFSCVPKGFSQCLIMMAHDKSTSITGKISQVGNGDFLSVWIDQDGSGQIKTPNL
jgi:hypothetical protein